MSSRAGGKDYDPAAWAAKRKEAMDKAKKLREDRKSGTAGSAPEDLTFTPATNPRPSEHSSSSHGSAPSQPPRQQQGGYQSSAFDEMPVGRNPNMGGGNSQYVNPFDEMPVGGGGISGKKIVNPASSAAAPSWEQPPPSHSSRQQQQQQQAPRAKTLSQLATDSLDEFYQDNNDPNSMNIVGTNGGRKGGPSAGYGSRDDRDGSRPGAGNLSVGYRGFQTFGSNSGGGGGQPSYGSGNGSQTAASPSGSDTLASEVRQRGDVRLPPSSTRQPATSSQSAYVNPIDELPVGGGRSSFNVPEHKPQDAGMTAGRGRGRPRPQAGAQQYPYDNVGGGDEYGNGASASAKQTMQADPYGAEQPLGGKAGGRNSKQKEAEMREFEREQREYRRQLEEAGEVPAGRALQASPSSSVEWKHKNTRDMSDLWSSPPRGGERRNREGSVGSSSVDYNDNDDDGSLGRDRQSSNKGLYVDGRSTAPDSYRDPYASGPPSNVSSNAGKNHWSQGIDVDDEDKKLSLLKQRMASRQQQRHSTSAGTMGGPDRRSRSDSDGAGSSAPVGSSMGLGNVGKQPSSMQTFGSRGGKGSAAADAAAIRYRAQTTPEYSSPRQSPRAMMAAAEQDRAAREGRRPGGAGPKKPVASGWDEDSGEDADGYKGGSGGGRVKSFEEEQREWRMQMGGGEGGMAAEEQPNRQREQPVQQRAGPRKKAAPEWNSDTSTPMSAFEIEQQEWKRQQQQASEEQQQPRSSKQQQSNKPPARKMPEWNSEVNEPGGFDNVPPRGQAGRSAGQRSEPPAASSAAARKKPAPEWNSDTTEPGGFDSFPTQRQQQPRNSAAAARQQDPPPNPKTKEGRATQQAQQKQAQMSAFEQEQREYLNQQRGGGGQTAFEQPQGVKKPQSQMSDFEREQQEYSRAGKGGGGGYQPPPQQQQPHRKQPPPPKQEPPQQQQRQQPQQQRQQPQLSKQQSYEEQPPSYRAPPPESPRVLGGTIPDDALNATDETIHCDDCGKSFAPPTYNRICKEYNDKGVLKCVAMYHSKRKVFNSAKVRIQGNEHLSKDEQKVLVKARLAIVAEQKQKEKMEELGISTAKESDKKAKWKEESNAFREAMKANRLMDKAKKEGKPVDFYLEPSSGPSIPSDYLNCPHCGRNFNQQAGARHIPLCNSKPKGGKMKR